MNSPEHVRHYTDFNFLEKLNRTYVNRTFLLKNKIIALFNYMVFGCHRGPRFEDTRFSLETTNILDYFFLDLNWF